MFRDLVEKYCQSKLIKRPFKDLQALPALKTPNGFVFHESRVGSTLVADMLASDADNMVRGVCDGDASVPHACTGVLRVVAASHGTERM